jgi:sialic acid synthase SpsE/spore coat polysaccharide biosynthesis protein SpsF (cytidylyltransferase family)
MKVGAIILARLSSSRLPSKALRKIQQKELLIHIIDGLKMCHSLTDIIVATSSQKSDDAIESLCQRHGINCFRGDLNNVACRFLDAAKFYGLSHAVRINGDNFFLNPSLIDQMCRKASKGYNFVSNVPGRTFPKGMSVELIKVSWYQDVLEEFTNEQHFEHVTSYLYECNYSDSEVHYEINPIKNIAGIQLAIDTRHDLHRANKIVGMGWKCEYKLNELQLAQLFTEAEKNMNFVGKYGPLLIAEIGGNHEGDFEYAKKLTQLAIESDADVIKFQMYSGDTLVNPIEDPSRHKHFQRFELSKEQYIELAQMVTRAGKKFMASVWDAEMIDWVDSFMPIYKVGSGDLLAWSLLGTLATRGKPIILSTGLATESEVLETVEFLRSQNEIYFNPNFLAILQCTSMYPIPFSDANLATMSSLRDLTNATVGYSDHTEGSVALKVATAMGAKVLEFHFTDDRSGKEFRDHKVSLTKDEVLDLIEHIKEIDLLSGDPVKRPALIEEENGHVDSFRRAIYPARDMVAGHIVAEDDFVSLRPCHGVSSHRIYELCGKKLTRAVCKFEKLSLDDFA